MLDIRSVVDRCEATIAGHNLGAPGAYLRWSRAWANHPLESEPNPYGCADAANILYSIGRFSRRANERRQWIASLQALQDKQTGLFHEPTHHPIHTTAHCIAALELFDAGPRYPLRALAQYTQPEQMEAFLDGLDWMHNPWSASHQGAGLYVSLVLTGAVSLDWQDRYFAWLAGQSDEGSGFWRRGCVQPVQHGETMSIFPHLAGTFHYFFNHVYARRPFPHPRAVIDTCLRIFAHNEYPLGDAVGFAEIDWVFCLTRSLQQTGYRFQECRAALEAFAGRYIPFMSRGDPAVSPGFDDLHALFGAVCCLSELQQAVPGLIRSERPLKLVLDRRPFI